MVLNSYHKPILFLIIKIHSISSCYGNTTSLKNKFFKFCHEAYSRPEVFILRIGRKLYNFPVHKCLINIENCFPIYSRSSALRVLRT